MDSFIPGLKSGLGLELVPNLEWLTKTSEYGEPSQRLGTDPREKLPTRLSGKPTEFEKQLRDIVLEVYSDQTREKSLMSHPVEETISSRPDDLISGRTRDLLSNFRAESGAAQERNGTEQRVPPHPGLFQSCHNDDTDSFPPRSLSISETDILTPAFNDSGIQLEFITSESDHSDTCSVESGGQSVYGVPERDISCLNDSTDNGNKLQTGTSESRNFRFSSDQLTTAPLCGTISRIAENVTVTQEPSHDHTCDEVQSLHNTPATSDSRDLFFSSDQLTSTSLPGTTRRVVENVIVTQEPSHDHTCDEVQSLHNTPATSDSRDLFFSSDQLTSTSLPGTTRRVVENVIVTQEPSHDNTCDDLQNTLATSDSRDLLFSSDQLITTPLPGTIRHVTVTQEPSHGMREHEASRGEADGHAITLKQANMEGRVELLHTEYSSVLQERKMLKIQLCAVEAKLKQELKNAKKPSDRSNITDGEQLQQKCLIIENELVKMQSDCQRKEYDLTDTREQLHTTQTKTRDLKEKLTKLESEMCAREESVNTLRNEMENIEIALTLAVEKNKSLTQEKDVLSSDVAALISAKEWFKKQLTFAQESRTKLQLEISEYESTVAGQNKIIEQLRCDSASTSKQLTTLQHEALDDKTQMLKHLEKVEEDMIKQGLTLKQIKLEKQTTERTLKVKIDALQKENEELNKLASAARDVDRELTSARQQVKTNECLLDKIRHEKGELEAQLGMTLNIVEDLKVQCAELEGLRDKADRELKAAKENDEASTVLIQSLKEQKRKSEEKLATAKEETAAFDSAVGTLKVDLERVERRFKLMKRELTKKTADLELMSRQKDGFIHELRMLRDELDRQLSLREALREGVVRKDKLIEELQGVRVQLVQEISGLTEELKQSEVQRAQADSDARRLDEKLKSADRDRTEVEGKSLVLLAEKARIEGELETSQQMWGEEANSLKCQIERLREEMARVKRTYQGEFLKERNKIISLEQKLERARQELLMKEDKLVLDLQAVHEKLEQEKKDKEAVEAQLKKLHTTTEHSVGQLKKKYQVDLKQAHAQTASLLEARDRLDRDLAELRKQSGHQIEHMTEEIRSLKAELTSLRNMLKQRQEAVSRMQLVAIELEREKGRCAGILASQRILREHTAILEETLGAREAALSEMTSNFECSEKERELQQMKTGEKIALLESSLKSQRDVNQELRSLMSKEKKEKAKLQEINIGSKQDLEETQDKLVIATSEGHRLVEELERVRGKVTQYSDQLRSVRSELENSQLVRGKLQTRLNVLRDEEKTREDHVTAVQWEATQRQRDVTYMKEQLRLMEERQQMELENFRSALQVSRSEVNSLRMELSDVRKTKCVKQSEVFQLRDALLTAKQGTECVRQQLFAKCQQLDAIKNAVHVANDVNQLKEEVSRDGAGDIRDVDDKSCASAPTVQADSETSPLKSLQTCMDSLRCQIINLEQQMNRHTHAVHNSASSWRTFEKNVKELQASCSASKTQVLPAERDTN